MESNIQGSLLLPLVRVGFISSPFRSPIARSSIGGLFFSFWSFRKHSAWGEWLRPADSLRAEFCLGRMCAVESQSSQMEGTERHPPGKESAGRWPQGRKYCSTASHAARNGVQPIEGLAFSLFGTPQHLHRVFRVKRNLGYNLFFKCYTWVL